jgi:hypothetical protein
VQFYYVNGRLALEFIGFFTLARVLLDGRFFFPFEVSIDDNTTVLLVPIEFSQNTKTGRTDPFSVYNGSLSRSDLMQPGNPRKVCGYFVAGNCGSCQYNLSRIWDYDARGIRRDYCPRNESQ